jgi:hypothetical protein
MTGQRHLSAALFAGLAAALFDAALPAQTPSPEALERLRRDQDEILRKAEHLQALMQRLLQRYEREGKDEKKLLQEGLAHLERSGILRDVAGIRDDLASTAWNEALRKQREVVDDLERLLNILLERKSAEVLDQQIKAAAAQAANARELERRQRELQRETAEALRREPSPAEQALLDTLQQLQRSEAAEAQRNAQQAGTRRPFLENALQRVEELLRQQQRLEQGLADEASGRTAAARARQFDLGNLNQRARELASQIRGQARQEDLQKAAEALATEAAGTDQQALQQARDRFEAMVQDAPKLPGGSDGPTRDKQWEELLAELRKAPAGATPMERDELRQIAERGKQLAEQRSQQSAERNAADAAKLQRDAEQQAEAQPPAAGKEAGNDAAASLQEAGKQLQQAADAARQRKTSEAAERLGQAQSQLERARQQDAQQNPDAERQAAEMAAEAAATARELQNAPSGERAEQTAGEQLQQAERALRQAGETVAKARDAGARPAAEPEAKTAREKLEAARDTLQQALGEATQGQQDSLQEAADRQQQLQQAAQQAARAMQQAQQNGQLTPQQADGAQRELDRAQQRMQEAQQQLRSGQQASASEQQAAAAEALQQAGEALQQNRPVDEQQKQALKAEAARQQELADDIAKLAEELKKRDNKQAQQAAEQAADAARKARRALDQADADETREQQEKARQKLQEAAEQLDEEKDRYQDLRQEELLFKMKAELTAFLERQQPITAQTLEAQQQAEREALSRPARRKLNQLGEEEQELAGKIGVLVAALSEEGNLVYRAVLDANLEDLREIARRLGGRAPDPGRFTTLMQQDVERRSQELLAALERERQRREQEKKDQEQQKKQDGQDSKNRFNPQREKLVGLIAELEMLKSLQLDTAKTTDNQRLLIEARSDEVISEAEVALVERLSHRHAEISRLFAQIKAGIEQTLQQGQGEEENHAPGQGGRGK